MEIQSTDKLLIGRDGQSYQTDFENSGIPTKDNLDEHLHKTVGGTVVGNTEYTGDITLDNHLANKGYVDSTLSNYIPITGSEAGKPVTGDIDLSTNTFLNIAGNGAGVRIKTGYWGGLKYGDVLQLEWGKSGVKTGVDINMKIGNTGLTDGVALSQFNGTGEFSGNRIHWLKDPEHQYDAVNKNYVDEKFATTEYVDTEIANLGDLLVFKGTIDFTTTAAPTEFAVGHVYANSVAGTPDPSWGLTGDVSVGDLYGRGENQWGIVGSTQSEIGDFLPLTGGTLTGDLNFKNDANRADRITLDFSTGYGLGSGVFFVHNGSPMLTFTEEDGIFFGGSANSVQFRTSDDDDYYFEFSPKTSYEDCEAKYWGLITKPNHITTKEYVDGYAMPKNLNTLPALG